MNWNNSLIRVLRMIVKPSRSKAQSISLTGVLRNRCISLPIISHSDCEDFPADI